MNDNLVWQAAIMQYCSQRRRWKMNHKQPTSA